MADVVILDNTNISISFLQHKATADINLLDPSSMANSRNPAQCKISWCQEVSRSIIALGQYFT